MYNLLLDKKGKHVHLYQIGEKRVLTIHKKLGTKCLNSLLNLYKKKNNNGYKFKFFIELFRKQNIFST